MFQQKQKVFHEKKGQNSHISPCCLSSSSLATSGSPLQTARTETTVCVCCSYPGRMLCSHHHLIPPESGWQHSEALCVWTRVLVCTYYENVYMRVEKKSHGAVMSHSQRSNSSHMCCVIQVSAHWATIAACFLKTPAQCASITWCNRVRSGDTTLGSDGGGI